MATNTTSQFANLRYELEDLFADLHQMLDVRRQQLLDKLTELEEIYNKYEKQITAINKLTFNIEIMKETFDNDDLLEDAQDAALAVFQQKLENLKEENVKSVIIDNLKPICDKNKFRLCLNSISISDSVILMDYCKKDSPVLSKVMLGNNKGEINHPHGISIDSIMNEVYICDYNLTSGSSVNVFSLEGVFIREFGEDNLESPHSIALSSSDVFVTNSLDSHCVMKFNKDGTFVKKIGSKGRGDGQFNFPLGVCVANESVFVCDFYNDRIQAYDFNLSYLFKFSSEGLANPQGIRYYSNQLFVSKKTGSSIFVYSLEGTYIKSIQLTGEGSPLNKACYFTIDFSGNYLFSEYQLNCIKIFSPSGEYIASLGNFNLESPKGLAIDKQRKIICVCRKNGAVFQTY